MEFERFDLEEYLRVKREQSMEQGYKIGLEEGLKQGASDVVRIAWRLLLRGLPIHFVVAVTELPLDGVEWLKIRADCRDCSAERIDQEYLRYWVKGGGTDCANVRKAVEERKK